MTEAKLDPADRRKSRRGGVGRRRRVGRVQPCLGKSAQASDSPAMTAGTMGKPCKAAGAVTSVDARDAILYSTPSLNTDMCKCSQFHGGGLFIKRFVSRLKNNCSLPGHFLQEFRTAVS